MYLYGHWIRTITTRKKFLSEVFFNSTYFMMITSFLSYIQNMTFKLLSNYHNNIYNNPTNRLLLKKLVSYDYTDKILQLKTLNLTKMYTNYNYMYRNKIWSSHLSVVENFRKCSSANEYIEIVYFLRVDLLTLLYV